MTHRSDPPHHPTAPPPAHYQISTLSNQAASKPHPESDLLPNRHRYSADYHHIQSRERQQDSKNQRCNLKPVFADRPANLKFAHYEVVTITTVQHRSCCCVNLARLVLSYYCRVSFFILY